jgi:hypothetical protein
MDRRRAGDSGTRLPAGDGGEWAVVSVAKPVWHPSDPLRHKHFTRVGLGFFLIKRTGGSRRWGEVNMCPIAVPCHLRLSLLLVISSW